MFTDPSGEFWHLIIGAFVGGAMNWMMNGCQWNAEGLGYFAVGALAGALGAGVGAGVSSVLAGTSFSAGFVGAETAAVAGSSFANGFQVGMSGGLTSGFVNGMGNSLMQGNSMDEAIVNGFKVGIYAGLSGGISGGIIGAANGYKEKLAFTKGCKNLGIEPNKPVPATDEFLSKSQKAWYPEAPIDKTKKFTVENVSPKHQAILDANKAPAMTKAILDANNNLTGYSNVYFNKNLAFLSAKDLYYAMGHEFVHVSQFAVLQGQPASLLTRDFVDMLEFHAYSYQNSLGGLQLNSFEKNDIIRWSQTYPTFQSTNYSNFPWTTNTKFYYPL